MRQTTDTPSTPELPGRDPAEGRPDMGLPGADRDAPIDEPIPMSQRTPGDAPDPGWPGPDRQPPDGPQADLPERLGQRVENGPGTGIASGEPDLVPDVEIPDESM